MAEISVPALVLSGAKSGVVKFGCYNPKSDACNDRDPSVAQVLKNLASTAGQSGPSGFRLEPSDSRYRGASRGSQGSMVFGAGQMGVPWAKDAGEKSLKPLKDDIVLHQIDGDEDSSTGNDNIPRLPNADNPADEDAKKRKWGSKIGSVLSTPRRFRSRRRSTDSPDLGPNEIDEPQRVHTPPRNCPTANSKCNDSLGKHGAGNSPLPAPNEGTGGAMEVENLLDTKGGTPAVLHDNIDKGSTGSPAAGNEPTTTRSPSRISQNFARYSNKISSWRTPRSTAGVRGEGSPPDGATTDDLSLDRSSRLPHSRNLKVRVNRFLRPTKHSYDSSASPATKPRTEELSSSPPPHVATSGIHIDSELPPHVKSGLRSSLGKRMISARKRVSLPFIFGLESTSEPPTIPLVEPPSRPQTVPPGGYSQNSLTHRTEFVLGDLPGHAFLPSEAKIVIPRDTPPLLTNNTVVREWAPCDFRDMNMIQSQRPLAFPGDEDSPPQSPWSQRDISHDKGQTMSFPLPKIPDISAVAPFTVLELTGKCEDTDDGPPKKANISRGEVTRDGNFLPVEHENKGGSSTASSENESEALDTLVNLPSLPGGKPIELLEEQERRQKRDSGMMGLNPEVRSGDKASATGGPGGGGREDTYGAAVREIAGLDIVLRGPPVAPPPNLNLGDVSRPNITANSLSPPTLLVTSNGEHTDIPAASAPPSPTSASSAMRAETQPDNPASPNTLGTESTLNPAVITALNASAASGQTHSSQQQLLLSGRVASPFVLEELSNSVCVKVAPQQMATPLTGSLSTAMTTSHPDTPLAGTNSRGSPRSPISVRICNGNCSAYGAGFDYHLDEEDEGNGGGPREG